VFLGGVEVYQHCCESYSRVGGAGGWCYWVVISQNVHLMEHHRLP